MRQFYYGWFAVALAMFANMLLIGITYASFGLFVLPVSHEFGLSRADMNMALVLVQFGSAMTAPMAGSLLDRLPIRPILVGSAICWGLCLLVLGSSKSLWVIMAVLLLPYPLFLHGAGIQSMNVLLVRWFKARRARAITLATLGMSFGSLFVPPAMGAVIELLGWQPALMVAGGVVIVLLAPLYLLIRVEPGPGDVEPAVAASDSKVRQEDASLSPHLGIGAILRMPVFWTITISTGFSIAVVSTMLATLVPLGIGNGLSTVEAATLISAMGASAMGFKILVAAAGDRIEKNYLLAGIFILTGIICAIMMMTKSYWAMLAVSLAFGISSPMSPVFYALLADRFGRNSFGTVMGMMFLTNALIGAAGYRLAGEIFDRTGGYDLMLIIFFFGELAAAAILILGRKLDRALLVRSARRAPFSPDLSKP